jgi:hypothetical protein
MDADWVTKELDREPRESPRMGMQFLVLSYCEIRAIRGSFIPWE